ncbi:U6 snRNA-associated Sm-like protein LSm8 [Neolecta irregularis DAH-3]|uniref:LSM2-LSM8 complex subunit LSM8 n=1 Tax=Neolecta irregularis (strain DAH-3) TaxID=1198029 RepID=A0A1U7LGN1_NEOID|nr:U6 snRNA-associated Sm-like protein LSm8 [Neolecta irregularis DAH-3]|eukprot:OLL21807.1 U6 snRNA-associated Sm-like protein LSm8 [Neolecta irregularis DAH-3]
MSSLQTFVNKLVTIVTADGRILTGDLIGYDQTTNLILKNTEERIFRIDEGVEIAKLGLYVLRGDSIVLVGETDTELEDKIDWLKIKADQIQEVRHGM